MMDISTRLSFFLLLAVIHRGASALHPTATVVGTVYCDTCFHQEPAKSNHLLSGATVAVECGQSFRKEVKTNEQGVFQVRLPLEVSKHIKRIKACSVKLINSNEPFCAVASSATSSAIRHLKPTKKNDHVFSAGFFSFRPLQQPELCYQKPNLTDATKYGPVKDLSPLPELPPLNLPPVIPQLPVPALPSLPFVPFLPKLEQQGQRKYEDSPSVVASRPAGPQKRNHPAFFLPNPPPLPFPVPEHAFRGRTLPLPPNPFRPPTIHPPTAQQPPAATVPTFPGITPSPPVNTLPPAPNLATSPPPPASFRFPPFPFPPLFPGYPPHFPPEKVSP